MKCLERRFLLKPRILNQLHRFGLVNAISQMNDRELAALERHAAGARAALEIGTHQGVSAARIVRGMAADGVLYCVDPWPEREGRPNPCWLICERHLHRTGTIARIKIIRGFSGEVQAVIPQNLDFAFIDGDHSWDGIQTDWNLVSPRIAHGGVVCLHDSVAPPGQEWPIMDSVRFFREVIAKDAAFETVESVSSLTVLRKIQRTAT